MGIPHLITHLRPYAVAGDLTGRAVVIDGPAFAYHIFHICLAAQQDARNPFEATPSYALLGKTAIQWLDALRSRDVQLKKIYFDGFLPKSKRTVRGDRLRGYTKQLSGYHEAWPQVIPPRISSKASEVPVELFTSKPVPPGSSKIPAAPFLVPAIIEALQGSQVYRGIAEVVPGEADLYCARYLRQEGGCVLTSDSDLLVHELGPEGSVGFLKDVQLVPTRGVMSIKCVQYKLKAIAERLGLPEAYGLKSLAFEISMDIHASFPQLLQRAVKLQSVLSMRNSYEEFCTQYTPLLIESGDADAPERGIRKFLQSLDPRVSEFVLQFPRFAKIAKLEDEQTVEDTQMGRSEVEMFMPFLLDCPVRTSAWEPSTAVRQLAYGLLNLSVPGSESVLTVTEHRRQQQTGGGREWQVPNQEQIQEACTGLSALLTRLKGINPKLSAVEVWRVMALQQEVAAASSAGKTSLSQALFDTYKSQSSPRISWDAVHLTAQLHGSYYSFRILQQTLNILCVAMPQAEIPEHIAALHKQISTLPPLRDLLPVGDTLAWLGKEGCRETLDMALLLSGLQKVQDLPSRASLKKEKKKRKRDGAGQAMEITPNKRPINPFELLAME